MQTHAYVQLRTKHLPLLARLRDRLTLLFSIFRLFKYVLQIIVLPAHLRARLLTFNQQDDSLPQMSEREATFPQPEISSKTSIEPPPPSDQLTEAHTYFKNLLAQGAFAFFAAFDTSEYQQHFHMVLNSLSEEERQRVQHQAEISEQQYKEHLAKGMSPPEAILANAEASYTLYLFTGEQPPK